MVSKMESRRVAEVHGGKNLVTNTRHTMKRSQHWTYDCKTQTIRSVKNVEKALSMERDKGTMEYSLTLT